MLRSQGVSVRDEIRKRFVILMYIRHYFCRRNTPLETSELNRHSLSGPFRKIAFTRISSIVLTASLIGAAGCSQQGVSPALPSATTPFAHGVTAFAAGPANAGFRTLYSFAGPSGDGANPMGKLAPQEHGGFEGTTAKGGTDNFGTVFLFLTAGKSRVIYNFTGKPDGAIPEGGMTDYYYGTTSKGGVHNQGTIFSLPISGHEAQILHSFAGKTDGSGPIGELLKVGTNYYGTTSLGGSGGGGTAFVWDSNRDTFTVLHHFDTYGNGGWHPLGSLIKVGGDLYGTTANGGQHNRGTVYRLNPTSGEEKVLYSFPGKPDGDQPDGELVSYPGVLYGTTRLGGEHNDGMVFELPLGGGRVTVLHSFTHAEGMWPVAGLTLLNRRLYGTTSAGGDASDGSIFELQRERTFKVLHQFKGSDGASPYATMVARDGKLYGTTRLGGTANKGTIFEVKP